MAFAQAGHEAALGGPDLATQRSEDVRQFGSEAALTLFWSPWGGKTGKGVCVPL